MTIVKRSLILIPLCLLAACNRTPSFDERYDAQAKTLHGSANSIEMEVANQITGADVAERAVHGAAQGAGNGAKLP